MSILIFSLLLTIIISRAMTLQNLANIECGKIRKTRINSARIVGGENAIRGEFPWLVSLTRRGGHFCGGSLVTNQHVLTAGHCMCSGIGSDYLTPSSIKITLGQHDLSSSSPEAYQISVETINVHPEYLCSKPKSDVAVLTLRRKVLWSQFVSPACLPSSSDQTYENTLAIVAGWGWTHEDSQKGGRAKILQKAKVNVIENETCKSWFKSQGKKTKIQDTQICAGYENGGIDACRADSGGPLMVDDDNQMVVIGIVSTGIGCARPYLPGLYTRLSEYVPWIKTIITRLK